jgi:hypothetical protein
MKKEGYEFISEKDLYYSFLSIGKKEIPKIVIFQIIDENTYNLVLADFDFSTTKFSDTIVSNNGDLGKIMATVLKIILHFIDNHPDSRIILQGNTATKRQLYNRMLNNYYSELSAFIYVEVLIYKQLKEFEIGNKSDIFYIYGRNKK